MARLKLQSSRHIGYVVLQSIVKSDDYFRFKRTISEPLALKYHEWLIDDIVSSNAQNATKMLKLIKDMGNNRVKNRCVAAANLVVYNRALAAVNAADAAGDPNEFTRVMTSPVTPSTSHTRYKSMPIPRTPLAHRLTRAYCEKLLDDIVISCSHRHINAMLRTVRDNTPYPSIRHRCAELFVDCN